MTCVAPSLLTDDIVTSRTLSPTVPRTPATPSSYPLGYEYPVVDYVVNGATVNNCSLNIDPGTILAFTSPGDTYPIYEWGIRLNPGARLNVYGVPTNRVIFTRLEGIQESPASSYQQYGGPLITFKGVFLPTGTMVTPLPEAHIHYADFPALAGNAVHFGPMLFEPASTYDCVGTLELDGCLFQAGDLLYESGGPQGRSLSLRNNIFERSTLEFMNRLQPTGRAYQETFTAFNNLFYDADLWLRDVSNAGASWTFTDNLFDNTTFHGDNIVGVNHNNGYVNMSGKHLSPTTETQPHPDLASLTYALGPLGRFYLPSTATQLLGAGGRKAGQAGLYHFTSLTTNAKEQNAMVNIGPAYLALDANGNPVDSNGDGVADFIADRNGDGNGGGDEVPWATINSGNLAVLWPNSDTVTGIINVAVNWGTAAGELEAASLVVDGEPWDGLGIAGPGSSLRALELDSRQLANGPHTLAVWAVAPSAAAEDEEGMNRCSAAVSFSAANDIRFPKGRGLASDLASIAVGGPQDLASYSLSIFGPDYAKAYNAQRTALRTGVAPLTDGARSFTEQFSLDSAGVVQGNAPQAIYTAVEFASSPGAPPGAVAAAQNTSVEPAWAGGDWVVTYTDNTGEYNGSLDEPILDPLNTEQPNGFVYVPWKHGWQFWGWNRCASLMGSQVWFTYPSGGSGNLHEPSTYPIRTLRGESTKKDDMDTLLGYLASPAVRNFYGSGHGDVLTFLTLPNSGWQDRGAKGKRFRFAFLDGCNTAYSAPDAFGRHADEKSQGAAPISLSDSTDGPTPRQWYIDNQKRPSLFLGWVTTVQWGIHIYPPATDPTTGRSCNWKFFDFLPRWHTSFLSQWQGNPARGAIAAIKYANSAVSYPDWIAVYDYDNNGRFFNFDTCLRIYGYGQMTFSGANDGSFLQQ